MTRIESPFIRCFPLDIPVTTLVYHNISPLRASASRLGRHFEKINVYDNVSGSWENFKEIYKPHKNVGQAILITTARKVTQLREMRTIGANNLLLLYPKDDESENKGTIAGVPCIAY